ncbi:MAG: hypothetical protein SOH95_00055 [Bifidobacterium crudilactis]|jgi:hypothetical protein
MTSTTKCVLVGVMIPVVVVCISVGFWYLLGAAILFGGMVIADRSE